VVKEESIIEDNIEEALEQIGESYTKQIKHYLYALIDLFFN
jgi:hypothetical protein